MSSITGYLSNTSFDTEHALAKKELLFQDRFHRIEKGTLCMTYPFKEPLIREDTDLSFYAIGYLDPARFERFIGLWRADRQKAMDELDGNFLLCIMSADKNEFWMINDIYGSYPSYYHLTDDGLFFSSFLRAMKYYVKEHRLDRRSMADLLRYGYCLEERTFYDNVSALRGGHCLHYKKDAHTLTVQAYYDFARPLNTTITFKEATDKAAAILEEEVLRMHTPGRTEHSFSSGGLDIRTVIAILREHDIPVNTFTATGADENDVYCANIIAEHKKGTHTTEYLDENVILEYGERTLIANECIASALMVPGFCTVNKYQKEMQELYDGYAGGPLFGVSSISPDIAGPDHKKDIEKYLWKKEKALPEKLIAPQFRTFYDDHFKAYFKGLMDRYYDINPLNILDVYNIIESQPRYIATGLQRARTMIDIKTPFATKRLYELVLSLPYEWHNESRLLQRAVLLKLSKTIARCPTCKTRYIGVVLSPFMRGIEYFFFRLNNLRCKLGWFSKRELFATSKAIDKVRSEWTAAIFAKEAILKDYIDFASLREYLKTCPERDFAVLYQIAQIFTYYF